MLKMLASVSLVDGNWREPKGVDVMWGCRARQSAASERYISNLKIAK
jgi:hypothetical protein